MSSNIRSFSPVAAVGRLGAALLLAMPLRAQAPDYTHTIVRVSRVELINHHPDCNPFAMAFDPVTPSGWGWRMPRILWHGLYPTANAGVKRGLEALHVNATIATGVSLVALPLLPHLRQAALGLKHGQVYQLNLYDWWYDWHNRNAINFADAHALGAWAVGDVALSCFARP